jgi:Cu(I)/Ag(I) efflux system membrane fusion protein
MNALTKGLVIAAAIVAAAATGLWAGQAGLLKLPLFPAAVKIGDHREASGPVIYYRDPNGKPHWSLKPKSTDDGRPFVAVRASEDVSFDSETSAALPAAAESGGRKIKYYRNPMGLPDTSPVPKKDSMGMDYVPVYEDEDRDDGSIKISPAKIQRTGVETVVVGKHAITRTVTAPGVVQLDERRIAVVSPRFDGYVEKVAPVTTGTHVKKGEVLATVFGQDVLNEAARLLIEQNAKARSDQTSGTSIGNVRIGGVVGATRRLRNLGVPQEFMERVRNEHRLPNTFKYRSPIDGEVLARNWSDGQGFKAGDVGFKIADLSSVWMIADVAEGDIASVRPGQNVVITTAAYPGRTFSGTVSLVYPRLMKETRTVPVRIELPNPSLALLPNMYGNVEIATGNDREVVAVPASAVIDSGRREVVLIDIGDGRFEPRTIKTGQRGDGFIEVLGGLAEGDKVVVDGNFLIDAESNLQSALKGFSASSTTEAGR